MVDRVPERCKPVDSKWCFDYKTEKKGNITKFKARLVGRGFTQTVFFLPSDWFKMLCRKGRLMVIGSQGRTVVGERHGPERLTARNSAECLVASAISSREDCRYLDIVYLSSCIYYSMEC